MEYKSLQKLEFIQFVREYLRKQLELNTAPNQLNNYINYYVNYLEQITQDYWDDQLSVVSLSKLYFDQSYQLIQDSIEEIEIKEYTPEYLFDFYDKLVDVYPLNIKSNFLIVYAMQYEYIYKQLPAQARKDLSDRRENLITQYQSPQIKGIKLKLRLNIKNQQVIDMAYLLFYDWYKVQVLKTPLQGYHQMLDIVDDAFVEQFKEQLEDCQKVQDNKLLSKLGRKQGECNQVAEFKKQCMLMIMHMRMKCPDSYMRFIKTYLKDGL